jgi:SAM-dependent methyltransferase
MMSSAIAGSAGTVAGASRSDVVSLLAIERTIITAVPDAAELARFYDDAYSEDPTASAEHSRWRALGAIGKADHVIELCERAGIRPASTLDVGCGDGALLSELHRRRFGGRLQGVEVSEAAASIARQRPHIDSVAHYDGAHLDAPDGSYELGVLSHVLEHVSDPASLLAEVARVCRAVVVEVPLEANWSARRADRRARAAEIGHLQRFDRRAVREIVSRAGLSVAGELDDPLPLAAHAFFASGVRARAAAICKWLLRGAIHRLAPGLARRLFTLHYACLCPPGGSRR